jgi:hypothetical protein
MHLTDYRALLIDCDEVLVDRDSGVWTALQPLLDNHPGLPGKDAVLAEFDAAVRGLYPRFSELGFSGLLCFAHRQLAERLGLKVSWEEGMSFARSACNWSLFEDAPGAMLYLRKFYRLLVYCDRSASVWGSLPRTCIRAPTIHWRMEHGCRRTSSSLRTSCKYPGRRHNRQSQRVFA